MSSKATDLKTFAKELQQELILEADVDGAEQMRSEVFTQQMIDTLVEVGELEDAGSCHLRQRGMEVHGYGVEDGLLNLITTIFTGDVPPQSVTKTSVAGAFKRLLTFWERCRDKSLHGQLEESAQAHDMALHLNQVSGDIRRIHLFLVTDGTTKVPRLETEEVGGLEIRRSVWDIQRLHDLRNSGQPREPIEIDFVERYGSPLPCLGAETGAEEYRAMLAVFPGDWLADIYHDYGARLLELNVRSFLQATGKVNRGLRDSLREEPERFLAYNNGITATAAAVTLVDTPNGGRGIGGLKDLQIVNGGQTTASIHRARMNQVELSQVFVQAKVTVVPPERLDEIVPLISRYANSQNKVSEADLRSNDPFHRDIEELSRTIWTPETGDALRRTKWYYERARGQYRDAVARAGTPAKQRAWKETHPPRQKFAKTDLAKFENAWAQLPDEVSKGAQKNFTIFMSQLAERSVKPDEAYFRRAVAKAILWRRSERLIAEQEYGGYRANLVAYTISKLSHATQQRLDLEAIWSAQALTGAVEGGIVDLSGLAWKVIVDDAPAGANITEWAKRKDCWEAMRSERWAVPAGISQGLVNLNSGPGSGVTPATENAYDDPAVVECSAVGSEGWFGLSNWAKQTSNLEPWHRKLAYDIGVRMSRGGIPSVKQALHGKRILDEARSLGYEPEKRADSPEGVGEAK